MRIPKPGELYKFKLNLVLALRYGESYAEYWFSNPWNLKQNDLVLVLSVPDERGMISALILKSHESLCLNINSDFYSNLEFVS